MELLWSSTWKQATNALPVYKDMNFLTKNITHLDILHNYFEMKTIHDALKRMYDKNDTSICKENLTDTTLMLAGLEVSQSERSLI